MGSSLGFALAAGGDLLAVGGPHADSDEGKGFLYRRDAAGSWIPLQQVFDAATSVVAVLGEHKCDSTAGGFGCQQVDLLSYLPRQDIGANRGTMLNDIWGWTDPQTKKEYALVGRTNGTSFVDVTNPAQRGVPRRPADARRRHARACGATSRCTRTMPSSWPTVRAIMGCRCSTSPSCARRAARR